MVRGNPLGIGPHHCLLCETGSLHNVCARLPGLELIEILLYHSSKGCIRCSATTYRVYVNFRALNSKCQACVASPFTHWGIWLAPSFYITFIPCHIALSNPWRSLLNKNWRDAFPVSFMILKDIFSFFSFSMLVLVQWHQEFIICFFCS